MMRRISFKIRMSLTVMLAWSMGGFAQYGGGSGTSGSPYLIKTDAHLAALATNVNNGNAYSGVYFRMENDISLAAYGISYNSGKGWIPIGDRVNNVPFSGKFNGNNHVITGLYIDDPLLVYGGLFGYAEAAEISNLGVEDLYINLGAGAGGLVGNFLHGGQITNCYTTGTIQCGYFTASNRSDAGGLVGYAGYSNASSTSTISIVAGYSTCDVNGLGFNVGGLVGLGAYIDMKRCYAIGTVSGAAIVGGLVGNAAYSSISYCAALNPKLVDLSGSGNVSSYFDRITTAASDITLLNNLAFDDMYYYDDIINWSSKSWSKKGGANGDGQDISKSAVSADGTFGNRFVGANGWTTQNGKLPGLFGNLVDIPTHLRMPIAPTITTTNFPNGKINLSYNEPILYTGDEPIQFYYTPNDMPPGLSMNSNPLRISGTPTTAGTFTFVLVADNNAGSDTKTFSITIDDVTPVTNISNVPAQAVIGTPLPLTGTVEPSNADNKNIEWKVLSAGNTGAVIISNTLHVTAEGTVLVQATIANGRATGVNYTQEFYITVSSVSIVEASNHPSPLRIYPNPTKGQLKINNEPLTIENIEIYDVMGKLLQSKIGNLQSEIILDISHLASGMYYLKVDGKMVKIVKE